MKEIPLENLSIFEGIFEINKDKHVVILQTIKTFMQRFKMFPELREKAKLYALCSEWENEGIFFMTFLTSDVENNIYFDCINDNSVKHFDILKNALKTLDYRVMTYFIFHRQEFINVVFELKDEMDLKLQIVHGACFRMEMENALKIELKLPLNHKIKSLSSDHVEYINSVWPHRYEQSELFIAYSIKYHVSVGLFDSDDNLVAWCLRYDNGALGVLQVDDNHLRKGYGELITKAITRQIAETFHCDVISLVAHDNEKSINLFKKIGFEVLGSHSWFGLQK